MKVLIVGGGEKPSRKLFEEYRSFCDYSIALDSGLDIFLEFDRIPNCVLGDFDSTKYSKEEIKKYNFIEFPPEKNYTDAELGLKKAIEFGAREIYLLAMTGKRLDHFMGNIGLLMQALNKGVKAFIVDKQNIITITDKSLELFDLGKKYISFYAYGGDVIGLTLKGSKYELNDYNLKPFEGICNSNEFKEEKINVKLKKGTLIIIYSQD